MDPFDTGTRLCLLWDDLRIVSIRGEPIASLPVTKAVCLFSLGIRPSNG